MSQVSRKRVRILYLLGWASALAAALTAAAVVSASYEEKEILRGELRERSRLRMQATAEHLGDHVRSTWLCLRLISLDPDIKKMRRAPFAHIQAMHRVTFAFHGLTEVYVTERDFDGTKHPFLSLFREDDGRLVEAHHPLQRESEEYTVHIEHIRRFIDDPSADFLISRPVQLCVGRPGVVCSVPIWTRTSMVGIVAGMVRSDAISEILESSSTGDEVFLVSQAGAVFSCQDATDEMRTWFEARFDPADPVGFFDGCGPALQAMGREMLWQEVDLPGSQKWYLAYVYNPTVHDDLAGVPTSLTTWSIAGVVLLLGIVVMRLCHVLPVLETARARADVHAEELAESEARTRAIVGTAADAIITIDECGTVLDFNRAAERIFGYDTAEVIGRNVSMLMDSPHKEEHHEYVKRYLSTGDSKIIGQSREVPGLRKNGTTVPLELDVSELDLGDRKLFTGLLRDVSERKQSEEALRQSEHRYRTLVENIELGVTLIDSDHNIVMTNQAQGRLLHKPLCEFAGRKCFEQFEGREAACQHCPGTRAMATGKAAEAETEGVRDDGSRVAVHIRAFPVFDGNGQATGFIEVVEDITERKRSERLARERQAELAHAARLGSVGEMAAGLAHELNQPLSAIVNYVQASLETIRSGRDCPEELLEDMNMAAGQAIRAGEVIERLRHFVGRPEPQRTRLGLNALVSEVLDLMRPEMRPYSIEAHVALDEALPAVEADGVQIQQVLVNLIKNGIEAMAENGAENRNLYLETKESADGTVECVVRDTGPGMTAEQCEQVFEAFFSTKGEGMGVGLSISRRIIEAHGGCLSATPVAHGAMFSFTLPICEMSEPA